MSDLASLLLLPFLAAVIFVGMHTWLGLQVLRRGVVFADLALAQLSALGATVAVAAGHVPGGPAGFGYALLFAGAGAVLLTLSRRVSAQVSQEAVIGIVYVVATALTVLAVDRSPQGAEHVKRMLVGDILTAGAGNVQTIALLYGAVGLLHLACRRKLLAAAGWAAGTLASLLGFAASVALDLPTGAAMVAAFAAVLLGAVLLRAGPRGVAMATVGVVALAVLTQGIWLIASPASDQPLLAAFERVSGLGPERSMTAGERRIFAEATETEARNRREVERLRAAERETRWKGEALSNEDLRRVASFQQTFNEMGRGERFVQDHLRAMARERERWTVGVPAVAASVLALLLVYRPRRRRTT